MIIRVTDPTHAAEARRYASAYAADANLDERERGSLAIVVTEISTNLLKHAGTGTIVVEPLAEDGRSGVRILGLDKANGIRNLSTALQDGYSTSGTPGNGLGAIRRLSSSFDIYSAPGMGTALLADFWGSQNGHSRSSPLQIGVVSVPVKGEEVCGDGWRARMIGGSAALMVVDGLGHGVLASEAARDAEQVFANSREASPSAILHDSHLSLKKTRGAAMAVATINSEKRLLSFAGVGNISASLISSGKSRGMASHNGTLGQILHKIQEFTFPWDHDSILIMHSDGLKSSWDLNAYPGILSRHPGLIAGLLFRDFYRDRDDVTVLVARNRSQEADDET